MLSKKIVLSMVVLGLLSSSLYAKKDENEHEKSNKEKHEKVDDRYYKEKHEKVDDGYYKEKHEKEKELPKGLEKKLAKDGSLPPGWEKKLSKGQIIDQSILGNGRILNSKDYPYMKNSQIYQVENRVFRVAEDTKMILEIFK